MRWHYQQWVASICVAVALGLLACAAYLFLALTPAPGLVIDETDITIAGIIPSQVQEVQLRLENNSGQPMRVLGLSLC